MALLSFSHFMVDFTCALLVVSLSGENIILAILLYNFCAFAVQMPLGIIVEGKFPPHKTASFGILLVMLAWLFPSLPEISLATAGIGNALFHLGGGLAVMGKSEKAAPLGSFIAPGALGIYFGAINELPLQIPVLLVMLILLILLFRKSDIEYREYKIKEFKGRHLAIISLFLVVTLRGFLGVVDAFPWKSEWSFFFVLAVVLGKVLGGYLSDKFGAYRVGVISLIISAICFIFPSNVFLGFLGMFSFQITMPITLWAISKITLKGFGFGLLTFGLFIGSIPTILAIPVDVPLSILVVISLIFFVYAMKKEVK